LTEEKQSKEDIVWAIAAWMKMNLTEREFGYRYGKLSELAADILETDRRNKDELVNLLAMLEGSPQDHIEALHEALVYVAKGFAKYSSTDDEWLEKYKKEVIHTEAAWVPSGLFAERRLFAADKMAVMA